jgi:hypothetical protein
MNDVRNSILLQLADGPVEWRGAAAQMLGEKSTKEVQELVITLGQLAAEGLVQRDNQTFILTLTEEGHAAFGAIMALELAKQLHVVKAPPRPEPVPKHLRGNDTYYGEELLATCHRVGAYDFLSKPSRMGDNLKAHPTAYLSGEDAL